MEGEEREQGLTTGSLRTGGLDTKQLQGASGLGKQPARKQEEEESPEADIARNYAKDLAGENGELARFRAIREIAQTEAQHIQNNTTFSSRTGAAIIGGDGFYAIEAGDGEGVSPIAEDPEPQIDLRRWRVNIVESDPSLVVSLNANKGRIGLGLYGDTEIPITGLDTEFPMTIGDRLYLKMQGVIDAEMNPDDWTATLLCDSAWNTPEPFRLNDNGDVIYSEFYYPFAVNIAYNEALEDRVEINLGETLGMLIVPAPDSNLTVIEGVFHGREGEQRATDKSFYVQYLYPPPGPWLLTP